MADQELATYAVVTDGTCVNVIVWDGVTDFDHDGADLIKLEDDGLGGIGWTYNPKATKSKWVDNRPTEEATDGDD